MRARFAFPLQTRPVEAEADRPGATAAVEPLPAAVRTPPAGIREPSPPYRAPPRGQRFQYRSSP
jgi:hypothetical protein